MSTNLTYLTYAAADAMLQAMAQGTSSSDFRSSASLKVQLLDDTFTYSPSKGHLSDIAAGERVGSAVAVSVNTIANGVLDLADPSTWSSLSGDDVYWWAVYDDSGVESTSIVLFYVKTFVNRPTTPVGTDVTGSWDDGDSKVLAFEFPSA